MKKFIFVPTLVLLLIAGLTTVSIAGHHYHDCGYLRDMAEVDRNEDGVITFEEFSAPLISKYQSAFEMLDTNSDDEISKDEPIDFFLWVVKRNFISAFN